MTYVSEVQRPSRPRLQAAEQVPQIVLREEPENEQQIEEIIQDSSDDIIDIIVNSRAVPFDVYFRRPCHAGAVLRSNLGIEITRLFMRNLGTMHRSPSAERQFQEEIMHHQQRPHTKSMLERIEEVEKKIDTLYLQDRKRKMTDKNVLTEEIMHHPRRPHIRSMLERIEEVEEKIDTLSQQDRKLKMTDKNVLTPKKQRSMGYISFRESQQARIREIEMAQPIEPNRQFLDKEGGEENVPENMQLIPDIMETTCPSKEAEKSIAAMLQEAGLLDTPTTEPEIEPVISQHISSKRQGSEGSETPLGSLDRSKVSLGDPEKTRDLKRFLRTQWGAKGTMMKVFNMIRTREREPITVLRLINEGPLISGHKAMIAARCFNSIMKLKQHGFITVKKNTKTLEIADIELGPKFN